MKIVVFDTETTGLLLPSTLPPEDQPRIIELGVAVIEEGVLTGEHNWIIDPECEITAEITKITGITNDDVKGKPKFREILAEIEPVFADSKYGIAHNAPFDVGMLTNELLLCARDGFPWPETVICSAQEYTHFLGYRPRLIQLYEHVMGCKLDQTHRALDDALALHAILSRDGYYGLLETI